MADNERVSVHGFREAGGRGWEGGGRGVLRRRVRRGLHHCRSEKCPTLPALAVHGLSMPRACTSFGSIPSYDPVKKCKACDDCPSGGGGGGGEGGIKKMQNQKEKTRKKTVMRRMAMLVVRMT